jgi:PKD repeat protein
MKTTKHTKMLVAMAMVSATLFLLSACGSDDDPAKPTASFTYESEGREVTFISTSKNAKTFSWDFGDGTTSTEQNPVHTYETYGVYTVKLKVTGDGGEANSLPDELTLAKESAIVIDGNLADWNDIPDLIVSSEGEGGTISKVKVDYNATKIFFYVEGTANLRGFFDIYLDTDNDPATGYFSGWYPMGYGADYLSEGDFALVNDADLFKDQAGEATVWGWDVASATGSGSIFSSDVVTKGAGKGIEFSIMRSAFTNLSTQGFSFAVVDVDGTVDPNVTVSWAKLGSLPVDNTEESKLAFVDLTK